MEAIAVIPARLDSTRLPRKPLLRIGGVPMVVRVARQAKKSKRISHVLVATDTQEIIDVVQEYGIKAVMTSKDCASGADRVAEAAKDFSKESIIVNVQGDEPFVSPLLIDQVIAPHFEDGQQRWDIVTAATRLNNTHEKQNPNVVKVVFQDNGKALYFSRAPIPYERENPHSAAHTFRHLGIYAYRHASLNRMQGLPPHTLERLEKLEQLRALACGMQIKVIQTPLLTKGIDTPADLAWAQNHVEEIPGN